MTKPDLITAISKSHRDDDLSKRLIGDILDEAFTRISKTLKNEKRFSYPGFGIFTVRSRKARRGRNPKTGKELMIKASKTVGFKPAPALKSLFEEKINKWV